jgi:hypothetical protein
MNLAEIYFVWCICSFREIKSKKCKLLIQRTVEERISFNAFFFKENLFFLFPMRHGNRICLGGS